METNVKVAVRCRPMSSKEEARGCGNIVEIDEATGHVQINGLEGADKGAKDGKEFTFDYAYGINSTQDQVYKAIGDPVVTQALDGFNCTVFAYGQTGSGKSYSMMGYGEDHGIIPKLNDDLWTRIDVQKAKVERELLKHDEGSEEAKAVGKVDFLVTVSFLEIYNEEIKDLLNPSSKQMKIRENKDKGIYVEDLCEVVVKDGKTVLDLIAQGNTVRRVAATKMNDTSSRSHSVFTLKIEQRTVSELEGGVTKTQMVKAKLNLVDLAGSERAEKTGATGSTLKEGANINMSLMALGNVINALSEMGNSKTKKHIPYRDSKLTRLLQESLGGNAATVMIAAISPADYNYDETLGTLKYAHRAKSIANAVVKNEDVNQRMIKDLKNEIEKLRAALAGGGGGGGGGGETDEEAARKIAELEEEQKNTFEERQKLADELDAARKANMSVVMSSMMDEAKEKKVAQMKEIKRLGNEKTNLQKRQKDIKSRHAKLKEKIDADMKLYMSFQAKHGDVLKANDGDANAPECKQLEKEMATVLGRIESGKESWVKVKSEAKSVKENLLKVEEEITDERAELVATAGLLDQNDKLRAQIQAEEREKAKLQIEKEIAETKAKLEAEFSDAGHGLQERIAVLEKEVQNAKCGESDAASELEEVKEQLESSKKYAAGLEEKLTDAEVARDAHEQEVTELKETVEKLNAHVVADGDGASELRAQVETLESEKYLMFKAMMSQFDIERRELVEKLSNSQELLARASQDIIYLHAENSDLRSKLSDAITFEPPIKL
jgi:hypothetical protein